MQEEKFSPVFGSKLSNHAGPGSSRIQRLWIQFGSGSGRNQQFWIWCTTTCIFQILLKTVLHNTAYN